MMQKINLIATEKYLSNDGRAITLINLMLLSGCWSYETECETKHVTQLTNNHPGHFHVSFENWCVDTLMFVN